MTKLSSINKERSLERLLAIRKWFACTKGQKLLSLEKPLINKALNYYFGRYLVDYGPLVTEYTGIKDIREFVSLGCIGSDADIFTEEQSWPILTEGADIVVLRHSLDFAYSPHDLLREAARCVRPGGHILIIGFNPYSVWGAFRRCHFGLLRKSNSISHWRLMDWLKLLGFSIDKDWKGGYCPPINNAWLQAGFVGIEGIGQQYLFYGNGFYVVSARKMMVQLTPLKSRKKSILGGLAPIPVINRSDVEINERDR